MSIHVPGIGDVPVVWMPATGPEDFARTRFGLPVVAIAHHRGVANLASIDDTFAADDFDPDTAGARDRNVSANFAVGIKEGRLEVHQYVNLSDTAFCNGDYHPDGRWDEWHGAKMVDIGGVSIWNTNVQTISIEHHDRGGSSDPDKKGLVPEKVIRASIELDRLLLSGDYAAIREAGIRCRDEATALQLGQIVPSRRTLIDHRDMAGPNKPYCWRPWKADEIGFPRQRYIEELTEPAPAPSPSPTYTQAEVDALTSAATAPLEARVAELQGALATTRRDLGVARGRISAGVAALTQ